MTNIDTKKTYKIWKAILFAVLIILLDLGSKSYVKNIFDIKQNTQPIEITNFLQITDLCNHGVSFGMLSNFSPFIIKIFILFVFLLLIIYSYFAIKTEKINIYYNFMIIGGAIANLIDRFQNGCVYDFLDFHLGSYHWYVFNIADSFITLGALLIIFSFDKKISKKKMIA